MESDENDQALARLRLWIAEELLRSIRHRCEVDDVIFHAESRSDALDALGQPPLGFHSLPAEYILDMQLGRRSLAGRRALEEEAAALREQLGLT